jgi:hypothetical protein
MKLLLMSLLIGLPLAAEGPQPERKETKETKEAAGAKQAGDTKKTRVVQTPFGPTLGAAPQDADKPAAPVNNLAGDRFVTFEESGDTVVFRRKTPFGDQVWRRKRTELTAAEKELMALRTAGGSGAAASDPTPVKK